MVFAIDLRTPFDLKMTSHIHGWVNLEPFKWEEESGTLRWCARIGASGHSITVSQIEPTALSVSAEPSADIEAIEKCVRRVLMLDWNASEAKKVAQLCNSDIANMVDAGAGRLLRGSSEFEDIVKTICTINTSWRNTQRMVGRLINFSGVGAFPTPYEILGAGTGQLVEEAKVGYRASTIIAVAKAALKEDSDSSKFEKINGVGPYASAHFAVLRGDYSTIPVDSEVKLYCSQHLRIQKPDAENVNDFFTPWGNYRFLGYKLGRMANTLNWIGD